MQEKDGRQSRRGMLAMIGGGTAGLITGSSSAQQAAKAPAIVGGGVVDGAVRMTRYGYRADGRSDDTRAWRDAIEEAGARNIGRIVVPAGVSGSSIVRDPIVHGPLPAGLIFEGETRNDATPVQQGSRIRYVGDGTCWFINHPGYAPPETGRWTWRNLTFEAADPAATMFDFNDAANHAPIDGRGHSYLMGATFDNCFVRGAQGGRRQTGDGIRAAKLFGLNITQSTRIRDWRRGIWLRGCDDCTISGRVELNARNIQHEQSGTFGSNLRIDSNFVGRCTPDPVETAYLLYDTGSGTACHGTFFEGGNGEHALVYLDGYATTLLGNRFTTAPFFELGPHAREITMLTPSCPIASDTLRPIIHEPASWDLGYQQQDRRLLILGGTKNFRRTVGAHPRIVWRDNFPQYSDSGAAIPVAQDAPMLADGGGYRPARRLLSALNYWAKTEGTLAQGGCRLIRDNDASGGWTMAIDAAVPFAGVAAEFVVGTDVQPGDELKVTLRYRTNEAGWRVTTHRDKAEEQPLLTLPATPGGYGRAAGSVSLKGWRRGETLAILIRPGGAGGRAMRLDFAEFAIVAPPVGTLAPAPIGNLGGAAAHADVQRQIADLTRTVNALADALRQRGDMAG